MDFGYTHDPTAIEEVWVHGDELWVDEIVYRTRMLTGEIIDALKRHRRERDRSFRIISESADPRLVDEIYGAGLDIHAVRKGAGSIQAGIAAMQGMRIKVTHRSADVIKEFRSYAWRRDKEGRWLNEPAGGWDYAIDGIRYVVLSEVLGGAWDGLDAAEIASML